MRLTEEDVREIVARAEELRHGGSVADSETLIRAAEEAGLSRDAIEQAIRERFQLPSEPLAEGTLVFARSSDGNFYVATVLSAEEGAIRVRFLKGGDHVVRLDEIRGCALLPGASVVVNWKHWGWAPGTITSYDSAKGEVKVQDWASEETVTLDKLRLEPPRKKQSRIGWWIYSAGIATGSILTWLGWLLFR